MEWFYSWWDSLNLISQIFACMAIPATVILLIQTVLLMFGVGSHPSDAGFSHDISHDFDHDFDHDAGHGLGHGFGHGLHDTTQFEKELHHENMEHSSGLRFLSLRGFVAFFAVGGWLGVALSETGINSVLAVTLALAGGFLALLLVALVMKLLYDMQESGNIDIRNAVAKNGKVYIRIPAKRQGSGKITLTVQDTFSEIDAVTDAEQDIMPGKMVQVVSVTADNMLVVRPLE